MQNHLSAAVVCAAALVLHSFSLSAQPTPAQPEEREKPAKENPPATDKGSPTKGEASTTSEPSNKPASPPKPAAPTPEDIAKARAAFIKGRELVEAKKHQEAVAQFKLSYRLSRNKILLYNIGFTLDETGNQDMALFYYEKFLKEAPADAPNYSVAKARVRKLRGNAEADAIFNHRENTSRGRARPKAKAPTVTDFQHNVVEEAPPGIPLDLTAFIPDNANWTVTLFYRGGGAPKFQRATMQTRYNELVGRIPKRVMRGSSVQYYLEVRERDGKLVSRSGRSTSPHLVFLDPNAKPRYYPDLDPNRKIQRPAEPKVGTRNPAYTGNAGTKDDRASKGGFLKWGTTGASLGFFTLAVSFYFVSANAASNIEAEAVESIRENCIMGPPCFTFADKQKDFESKGKTFQTLANVSLALGAVTAGAAGWLWYRDVKRKRAPGTSSPMTGSVVPVVGPGFVGASAGAKF